MEIINTRKKTSCILCSGKTEFFYRDENRGRSYYRCESCLSLMMDPADYLTQEEEKARYLTHNNDVEDPGYQKFVSPIVDAVLADYGPEDLGLDFGAGTGPVITSMLEEEDYQLKLYDPFFHPHPEKLEDSYDYIVCCEVMEHFYHPYDEFKKLYGLLNPGGTLYCMTSIYHEGIDFDKWGYKDDETHVFFYHKEALEWIRREFGFKDLKIDKKLIKLIKK